MMFHKIESAELRSRLRLKAFTIGFLGRFVAEKGVIDLLEAVSRIKSKYNILLVGDGELRNKITIEGRRLGISEQIRIVACIIHKLNNQCGNG